MSKKILKKISENSKTNTFKYILLQYPYRMSELLSDFKKEFGVLFTLNHFKKNKIEVNDFVFRITKIDTKIGGHYKGIGNKYSYFIELINKNGKS